MKTRWTPEFRPIIRLLNRWHIGAYGMSHHLAAVLSENQQVFAKFWDICAVWCCGDPLVLVVHFWCNGLQRWWWSCNGCNGGVGGMRLQTRGTRCSSTAHSPPDRATLGSLWQIDRYTKCMIVTPMFVTTSVWLLHHVRGRVRLQVLFNFHLDPSSCNSPWARVK